MREEKLEKKTGQSVVAEKIESTVVEENESTNQQINDLTIQQINDSTGPEWTEVIRPVSGWFDIHLDELWRYRDLIMLFVRRDFVAVYKLDHSWAIVVPDPADHYDPGFHGDLRQGRQTAH